MGGRDLAQPILSVGVRIGVCGQRHAPAALPPAERHCFHCTGGPSDYVKLYIFLNNFQPTAAQFSLTLL